MLSYRHSFHAGNFADVLKHTVAASILDYMLKKDKPLCYLDTHSGCGAYSFQSSEALKTKEFNNGIFPLWQRDDLPAPVARYVEQVAEFNAQSKLAHYPGSPSIARQMLRDTDRMFLFELHPNEFTSMRENFGGDRQIKMAKKDGLEGLVANMPPKERRGFILIDPSYEIKNEYDLVVERLIQAVRRFATGTYALWYPVVNRQVINRMERELKKSGIKNMQLFELGIQGDSAERGMTSSGMIVINPPWTLKKEMQESLPFLAETLGQDGQGFYRIETLAAE
ncbi:23S rRNA (adenine(2030)-N(6))-methyltransferase RlmJ [Psychromonas aquimarina]|uniref:23S rRNA (adenine(2030)-N(6))-methyltransferase RlmJ n=1 Tax=Psychromonas aquimarina TaxID=444919 RepID=UPI0003FA9432|nr:23S rRNA (adenine(2030)-N(6))-methyltransferase RlmJ [Psychromonas aquimarina]